MNKYKKNQAAEKKHKITFIDLGVWMTFVCIIVIAAFIILSNVFDWQEKSENIDIEKTVLYVVEFKGLTSEQVEKIELNKNVNLVINDKKAKSSCKIVESKITTGSRWELSPDGDTMILVEDVASLTGFVTFELQCVYQEGTGYFFANNQILVGDTIELEIESIKICGECVTMTVNE